MNLKIGDVVILSPETHSAFKIYNENWRFDGPAFGIIVEFLQNGLIRVKFKDYAKGGTHSLPAESLVIKEIFESPLFKSLQEL